jgi:hypothetical protein
MNCEFCHTEHTVAVPLVHLNGTGGDDLLAQLDVAAEAVLNARKVVVQGSPNGRDYYLHEGAIEKVMAEHGARLQKLNEVLAELSDMRDHVQAQLDFREEQKRKR